MLPYKHSSFFPPTHGSIMLLPRQPRVFARLSRWQSQCQRRQPFKTNTNRPRSINQYSNMDLSLSWQTPIFNGVFFVFKSLLGIERQKKLKKIHFWPESLGAMSEYWYIERGQTQSHVCARHFFCSQVFFFKLVSLLVWRFVLWSRNVHRQQSEWIRGLRFKRNCGAASVGVLQDNLVLSTELTM